MFHSWLLRLYRLLPLHTRHFYVQCGLQCTGFVTLIKSHCTGPVQDGPRRCRACGGCRCPGKPPLATAQDRDRPRRTKANTEQATKAQRLGQAQQKEAAPPAPAAALPAPEMPGRAVPPCGKGRPAVARAASEALAAASRSSVPSCQAPKARWQRRPAKGRAAGAAAAAAGRLTVRRSAAARQLTAELVTVPGASSAGVQLPMRRRRRQRRPCRRLRPLRCAFVRTSALLRV